MARVAAKIEAVLRDWGDTPAVIQVGQADGTTTVSATEFLRQIHDTARQLSSWGIREKYLVPIFLANSTDFIILFLALLRIGAIPILAKLEYRTLELDEIFRNAQPHAVIVEKEHLQFLGPYLRNTTVITRSENRFSLVQSVDGAGPREDVPDDIASINYTYRGYGYPLGAMISHEQYLHGARVLQCEFQAGEKMLVMLPMAHIFTLVGCILAPLLYRMTSVVVDTMHPRLLFQYIQDFRIEYVTSVPEIYELLYRTRDPKFDLSSLKVFISGGSVLAPDSYERIRNAFSVDVCHGYGLTEFAPVSRNLRHQTRPGTVGPVCDEVACQIDNPGADGAGEILIRTPRDTGIYYRRPRETAEAHTKGWFRTGDAGRMVNGHLVFVRELKNTRKMNGNLVDMEEISRAIRLDKDVAEAAAGREDTTLFARIALRRHVDFDETARRLKTSLRRALAGYKIPHRFCAF